MCSIIWRHRFCKIWRLHTSQKGWCHMTWGKYFMLYEQNTLCIHHERLHRIPCVFRMHLIVTLQGCVDVQNPWKWKINTNHPYSDAVSRIYSVITSPIALIVLANFTPSIIILRNISELENVQYHMPPSFVKTWRLCYLYKQGRLRFLQKRWRHMILVNVLVSGECSAHP